MTIKQRIYYPQTTYSQRQLLFQTWQETGNINEACKRARTSRSTFYYWKERFEQGGYEALEKPEKPGSAKGIHISPEIQEKVKALKIANPDWGKRRIADELGKSNDWTPLISPNSVRRILQENGLWPETEPAKKKAPTNYGYSP